MNKIKLFVLLVLATFVSTAQAQYSQARPECEYMFKAELGYMPFVSNLGHAGAEGYYLDNLQHMLNVNVINGINIDQDYFLGFGVGYANAFVPSQLSDNLLGGKHCVMGFADFDYRPLSMEWAPMFYGRAGANYMLNSDGPYGNTLTPYIELGLGMNWFFDFRMVNMERNYRSLYLSIGFAYTQQTTFIPVRLGIRL